MLHQAPALFLPAGRRWPPEDERCAEPIPPTSKRSPLLFASSNWPELQAERVESLVACAQIVPQLMNNREPLVKQHPKNQLSLIILIRYLALIEDGQTVAPR